MAALKRSRLTALGLGRDRDGQAVLEFALVAPVMLILAFAILQFGLVMNAQLSLTEGVRQGASIAATGGSTASIDSAVAANAPTVGSLAVVVTQSTDSSAVTVSATGSYPVLLPDLPFLGSSIPLSASLTEEASGPARGS